MAPFLLLTGLGFVLFLLCLAAVVWAIRSGQFDDLDTPALRVLGEDTVPVTSTDDPHARP
jgi:cbb3-type cytochrome oxidase maturation protein